MRYLEHRTRKRKRHHESFIFISSDGEVRVSAPCRGGWRRPTPMERASYILTPIGCAAVTRRGRQ
jgi:hypothetical protein